MTTEIPAGLVDRNAVKAAIIDAINAMPARLSDQDTVTRDHAVTAMIIIEEIVDSSMPDADAPWWDWRDQVGIAEVRDHVLTHLAEPCNEAWERAHEAFEHAEAEASIKGRVSSVADPGSFDYDFVPTWLRVAIDWSDVHNGPRLRGSAGKARA